MDLRITLVLLAGLLVLVSLLQPLATRMRLPASVLLAVVGISLGVLSPPVGRADAGSALGAAPRSGATDAPPGPVAVIGIFADVGAPSRLRRLVAGEALLNDAAAIALFTVLVTIELGGQSGGAGAAAVTFVRQFVGGLIFGYV